MMNVNVMALTLLTKRLVPAMVKRRRGRILNVASTAALQPGPLVAVYYATFAVPEKSVFESRSAPSLPMCYGSLSEMRRDSGWSGLRGALPGFAFTALLASSFVGVRASDPMTMFVVAGVLARVVLLAAYLPARRAVHLNPVLAMRAE